MTRMADGSEALTGAAKLIDPQVTAKAKRRRFTAEYKRRILREADALAKTGGIGEMLRREGLYTSHLSSWRRERERGELEGLTAKKRGRKALAQAETIIEVQKKVATLLGIPLQSRDDGSDS